MDINRKENPFQNRDMRVILESAYFLLTLATFLF